jgi:hypothetical protein
MTEMAVPLFSLILLFIVMVAIKQYSEKKAEELRLFANKQLAIIRETEEVLFNNQESNLSNSINIMLRKRILDSLRRMAATSLKDNAIIQKINTMNNEINLFALSGASDHLNISFKPPADDNEAIKKIKSIKAIRIILASEQRLGKIDFFDYSNEDKALSGMQTKIATETHYNRGVAARSSGQQGTARESFERALAILNSSKVQNEYTLDKIASSKQQIEEITSGLKEDNQRHLEKIAEKEKDQLDVYFTPKKKW